ncbi:MAG: hypothetical protein D3903_07940 [Candidatus Electrothrix sp. GM3_4]|nr:hypothetical protein [Candidatus Electrothrix sp. GM3_4]
MPDNRFENKDGDQNIAQGEGAVGKQDNRTSTVSQDVDGNENTVAGRDVHIKKETHHHYAEPQPAPDSPASFTLLPSEDAVFLHRKTELAWLNKHLHPDKVVLTDFLLQFFTSAFLYQTTVLQSRLKYNVYLHFNHTGQV